MTGPDENLDMRRSRTREVVRKLRGIYPGVECSLTYENPLQLLIATILSAQCTDERVNMVTPGLFERYPTAADFADAPLEELEDLIRSTGFFRNKARNIQGCCQALVDIHDGEVPRSMDELVALDGVGRKDRQRRSGQRVRHRRGRCGGYARAPDFQSIGPDPAAGSGKNRAGSDRAGTEERLVGLAAPVYSSMDGRYATPGRPIVTGVALGRYARHKEGLDALPRKKRPFHAPYSTLREVFDRCLLLSLRTRKIYENWGLTFGVRRINFCPQNSTGYGLDRDRDSGPIQVEKCCVELCATAGEL